LVWNDKIYYKASGWKDIPCSISNNLVNLAESYNVAALGNTWAHAITTRIELRRLSIPVMEQGVLPRQLCILKSPLAPACTFNYGITAAGFVELN
jgi:hypothetical protein